MTPPKMVHVCIFLALLGCESILAQGTAQGRWVTLARLPTARQEISHVLWQDRILVPGGLNSGGGGSRVIEVYNYHSDSWEASFLLPLGLHHFPALAIGNQLFAVGGYFNGFTPSNRLLEYNQSSQEWDQLQPMPSARGAHAGVVFDGKIYVVGGRNASGNLNVNEVYDQAAKQWRSLSPMPTAREHLAAAVVDSLIYVVGGRTSSSTNLSALEAYSPASDRWYRLADMPTPRGGLAAAGMNGKLYVMGGEFFSGQGNGVFEENEEYDPLSNSWRAVAPMRTPRHGIGALAVGDSIYVIGGGPVAGFGVTDISEAFTFSEPLPIAPLDSSLPQTIILHQNAPNPFNPETLIRFEIQQGARVNLAIFSIDGTRVRTLLEAGVSAGSLTLSWDGRDDRGAPVASGIYLYQLVSGRQRAAKKMMLLR